MALGPESHGRSVLAEGLLPGEEQASDPLTAIPLCLQVPGCLEATAFTKHPRFWWRQ